MPTLQPFVENLTKAHAFQWHTSDGAVPDYVVAGMGTYYLTTQNGSVPISNGDWIIVEDVGGARTRMSDADFQIKYSATLP